MEIRTLENFNFIFPLICVGGCMLCTGAFAPNTRNESVKWSLFILILGWYDPYEILIMLLIKLSCNVRPNFCSHCKKFDIKGFLHSIVFTVFLCNIRNETIFLAIV